MLFVYVVLNGVCVFDVIKGVCFLNFCEMLCVMLVMVCLYGWKYCEMRLDVDIFFFK